MLFNKILIFLILSIQCYTQEIDTLRFYNNIKERVFLARGTNDIYFDLNKKSITKSSNKYYSNPEEEFLNFVYKIFKGRFLHKYNTEYLFVITLDSNSYLPFFGHADGYGPSTLIYVFDSNYNQISKLYSQEKITEIIGVVDIDKNGIDEVIMKSGDGGQGCHREWITVYHKDFDINNELLNVITFQSCLESGNPGESLVVNAEYEIVEKTISIKTQIDYYICMGQYDEYDEYGMLKIDNRFVKTEFKKDIYIYQNGNFEHLKDIDNVNWDDERLNVF
ncbi:MAG: hypothetical protein EHM58_04215 [Ignavibacteriae bacterium]|nr:MAG: hypothetical protein EHM58_04215 [Ignavibacteriota bacterium]